MPKLTYLNDRQWSKVFDFLYDEPRVRIGNPARLRQFVEAVFWILRGGCQWRLLPRERGNWNTVFKRFTAWSKKDVWQRLFEFCAEDPDLEAIAIDTSIVRAHACSAGYKKDSHAQEALGRSVGGFSTKIHAKVDALGNPLKVVLTGGNEADICQASLLIQGEQDRIIMADKAYDSNDFIIEGLINGCTMVIPSKNNRNLKREYDKHTYKERHIIECFFGKIKHFRRVFSRFDKAAKNFLSFVQIACAHVWLR